MDRQGWIIGLFKSANRTRHAERTRVIAGHGLCHCHGDVAPVVPHQHSRIGIIVRQRVEVYGRPHTRVQAQAQAQAQAHGLNPGGLVVVVVVVVLLLEEVVVLVLLLLVMLVVVVVLLLLLLVMLMLGA